MIAGNVPLDEIPHRFWVLRMLRSMAAGHLLVVAGSGALEHFLDGLPHVAALFPYLLDHEWITVHETHDGVCFYRLTERGFDFWREGERWWQSLPWTVQLRVRLVG